MSKTRIIALFVILLAGAFVVYYLYNNRSKTPLGISFSPAFQLLGKSTNTLNSALTHIMPINELDEKKYGDAIAKSYQSVSDSSNKEFIYLNKLVTEISKYSKKRFTYRVFMVSTPISNAFALPGGVICVTEGLMHTVKSEAQIVSILSHEMGHIERGHCFEAIKYELALKKINCSSMGELADFTFNLFLRHSFSKTQESDADDYGYSLLLLTPYDPMAFSDAFMELQKEEGNVQLKSGNIVSDYFDTHPPLPLRIEKYKVMASKWWETNHNNNKRYIGCENFKKRYPMSLHSFSNEWTEHNHLTNMNHEKMRK